MSTSISTRRRVLNMVVPGLVAAVLAPAAAGAHTPVAGGNPYAVPPILPPVTPAELRAIRIGEAAEARRSAYRLPSTARYDGAEMAVFAVEGISWLEVPPWHRAEAGGSVK